MNDGQLSVTISGTAFAAVDGDNGRPWTYASERRGKGLRYIITADRDGMRTLLEDLQDRADGTMDADPPHWKAACRKAIPHVRAVLSLTTT